MITAPEQQGGVLWRRLPANWILLFDKETGHAASSCGRGGLKNARSRPTSPYYSDMSLEMQEQFNGVVSGDVSPEDAAASLQQSLEQIVEAGA